MRKNEFAKKRLFDLPLWTISAHVQNIPNEQRPQTFLFNKQQIKKKHTSQKHNAHKPLP